MNRFIHFTIYEQVTSIAQEGWMFISDLEFVSSKLQDTTILLIRNLYIFKISGKSTNNTYLIFECY